MFNQNGNHHSGEGSQFRQSSPSYPQNNNSGSKYDQRSSQFASNRSPHNQHLNFLDEQESSGFENYRKQASQKSHQSQSNKRVGFSNVYQEDDWHEQEHPSQFSNGNQFGTSQQRQSNGGFEAYKRNQQGQEFGTRSQNSQNRHDNGQEDETGGFQGFNRNQIRKVNNDYNQQGVQGRPSHSDINPTPNFVPDEFDASNQAQSDIRYDFNSDEKLFQLVADEHHFINNDVIAKEINDQGDNISQRVSLKASSPAKLKSYVDELTTTPEGRASLIAKRDSLRGRGSYIARSSSTFVAKSPFEVTGMRASSQFNTRSPMARVSATPGNTNSKSPLNRKSTSRIDRHLLKKPINDTPERPSRPKFTIPKYEDSSDEDDGRGFLCGICVSKRSEKSKKNRT